MIESLHAHEMVFLEWLQAHRTPLTDVFFRFLDHFDRPEFAITLVPIIWYGVNQKWGVKIFFLLMINAFVNSLLKKMFGWPRPSQLDPSLGLVQVENFGFPSGAAQTAFILTILLISELKNVYAWVVGLSYLFLISFSRIYLGVHFSSDVLGGFLFGALLLYAFLKVYPICESAVAKLHPIFQLCFTFAPLSLLFLFPERFFQRIFFAIFGVGLGLILQEQMGLADSPPTTRFQAFYRASAALLFVGVTAYALQGTPLPVQFTVIGLMASLGVQIFLKKISQKNPNLL